MPRTEIVTLKLTPDEAEEFAREADRREVPLAVLVRETALAALRGPSAFTVADAMDAVADAFAFAVDQVSPEFDENGLILENERRNLDEADAALRPKLADAEADLAAAKRDQSTALSAGDVDAAAAAGTRDREAGERADLAREALARLTERRKIVLDGISTRDRTIARRAGEILRQTAVAPACQSLDAIAFALAEIFDVVALLRRYTHPRREPPRYISHRLIARLLDLAGGVAQSADAKTWLRVARPAVLEDFATRDVSDLLC